MPGGFGRGFAALFRERELIVRSDGRVRLIRLGRFMQIAIAVFITGAAGWGGYATYSHFEDAGALALRDREISRLEGLQAALDRDVSRSEARFNAIARTLEAKHAYLLAMVARKRELELLPGSDTRAREARERLLASRNALLAQLGALETVLDGEAPPAEGSRRESLDTERSRLIGRIDRLEDRLAILNRSQKGIAAPLAERAEDRLARVRSMIAATGIDVDAMTARLADGSHGAAGGPFIAAAPDATRGLGPTPAIAMLDGNLSRWDGLRQLLQVLPLANPVDHFYVASSFGKRRDPINKRWAMHHGVDLAGVYRSRINATAAGTVVSAGWNGNYGRMIEIDHGAGISTRYGHLRRISVKRGQKVSFRQKIGEMGNSGRSTGTHVHYEVLVNGKPHDPLKFMQAGDYVFEGE